MPFHSETGDSMPNFSLKVREAGKLLGETEVTLPELTFVPETAVALVRSDGTETPLLGWGNRLWVRMHEPAGKNGGSPAPMTLESFVRHANEARDGDPFGTSAFRSPFEPDRFLRPLATLPHAPKGAVLEARLGEVRAAARGLALVDGFVHRAVPEPVHVVSVGPRAVNVAVRFREDAGDLREIAWNIFRADRGHDAEVFARDLAERSGQDLQEPSGWLRVVYSQILRVDDVGGAFGEAFGRFRALGLPDDAGIGPCLADLPQDLSDPAAAEKASGVLGRIREILESPQDGSGDMRREAAIEVCGLVAARYEGVDRDWLAARAASPVFAP